VRVFAVEALVLRLCVGLVAGLRGNVGRADDVVNGQVARLLDDGLLQIGEALGRILPDLGKLLGGLCVDRFTLSERQTKTPERMALAPRDTYLLPDVSEEASEAHSPWAVGERLVCFLDFAVQRLLGSVVVGTILGLLPFLAIGVFLDKIISQIHAVCKCSVSMRECVFGKALRSPNPELETIDEVVE
jgi:hypothetical protein